jgi:integration host factor subunit beta
MPNAWWSEDGETMKTASQRVKTFTKRDIVKRVAAAHQANLATAAPWVDQVFAAVRDILMTDEPALRIEIRDFGVLEVKPTKSKPRARNPKSGEIIFVPSRRKTHFKPSKLLKKYLCQPLDGELRRSGDRTGKAGE